MNQNQPKKNTIWMIAVPSVGALLAIGILALVWFTEIEDGKQSDTARTETTKTTRSEKEVSDSKKENVLKFADWGVEMPMPTDVPKVTTTKVSRGGDEKYNLTVDAEGCGGSLGAIVRMKKSAIDTDDRLPSQYAGKTYEELAKSGWSNYTTLGEYVYDYEWSMAPSCDSAHSNEDFDASQNSGKSAKDVFSRQVRLMREIE